MTNCFRFTIGINISMNLLSTKYNGITYILLKIYMGQRIQEWAKKYLWKTASKKFEGVWSA